MSDEDLRNAERAFIANDDYNNYCRYVSEFTRHHAAPEFQAAYGIAHGWVPAAVHLFAPWNVTYLPRYWSSTRSVSDPCLPLHGILGWVLHGIFTHLISLSPRRCTCGGEERGHAPNCEWVVGTGDFSEEFHSVMRQWFGFTSANNLLERYLEEGWRGVHDELVAGEYTINDLMNVLNARLNWRYVFTTSVIPPEALEWGGMIPNANVSFNFILQDMGPAQRLPGQFAGPWSSFEFHINTDDSCEIKWSVVQGADNPARFGMQLMGLGTAISTAFAQRINDIPNLLAGYPVWQTGPYPLVGG